MKFLRQLPKEKRQKLVLVGIVTLAGVAGMVVFWIGEEYNSFTARKEKIKQLEPKILDAERKELAETRNEPLRRQLVSFVQTQQQNMVTGEPFGWSAREVTPVVERYPTIQVVNLRPGLKQPHPTSGGYEIYCFQMDVRSPYDELGRFICGLENRFPTTQIRMLDLTPGDPTGSVRVATIEAGFLIWPESGNVWVNSKPKEEPKKKP